MKQALLVECLLISSKHALYKTVCQVRRFNVMGIKLQCTETDVTYIPLILFITLLEY
jgi:hypothetical protein